MKHSSTHFWLATVCIALVASPVWRVTGAPPLQPQEIPEFLQKLAPKTPGKATGQAPDVEAARISLTSGGFLRSIGAPPGQHFAPATGAAGKSPEWTAHHFMINHSRLFGVQSTNVDYVTKRNRQSNGRHYLRLQQSHRNLPIVAAEVVVQINEQGGVECVLSDLALVTETLDSGSVPVTPALSAEQAVTKARAAFATQAGAQEIETTPVELAIFDPTVLDEAGPPALVWDFKVFTADRSRIHFRVLVNAVTGDLMRAWTLNCEALNRQISDKNNNTMAAATIVRTEGQPATGNVEVDNAYNFMGDTYNFYQTRHGRDSYNNAGVMLQMTVRYCDTNNPCPLTNAFSGPPMVFGNGFAVDDVVAHEYTHNVTASESQLIYTNASGAINESLSDVWGEFVDLSNNSGNDAAAVRWQVGEDMAIGAFRSMKSPTNFNDPDRLLSLLYQQPSTTTDNGGVHKNSGVNNKLCYLLTDGETFNNQIVYGFGINAVAALYYEVQVNFLTEAASWADLYNALRQAAVNLNWSTSARNNLFRACLAVEIIGPNDGQHVYVDKTSVCANPAGRSSCQSGYGPYITVGQGINGAHTADFLHIRGGNYNEPMTIDKIITLDAYGGAVTIGQ